MYRMVSLKEGGLNYPTWDNKHKNNMTEITDLKIYDLKEDWGVICNMIEGLPYSELLTQLLNNLKKQNGIRK